MTKQLTLIDTQPDWRLDEKTRKVGRRGIADARAALAAGRRARSSGPPADAGAGGGPPAGTAPTRRRVRTRPPTGTRSAA
jgi:hypothetical protein